MSTPFSDLASLDRLVHEPARLSILTVLASVESADFLSLKRITGLTGGNLSSHLTRLEEGGLVQVDKQFLEKRPNTKVRITAEGRQAVERHWRQLEELHRQTKDWKDSPP